MIEPITQGQMHRDYSVMDAVVRSGLTLDQLSGPERTKPVCTKRIKSGKSFLCTGIASAKARELVGAGILTEAECLKVGVRL